MRELPRPHGIWLLGCLLCSGIAHAATETIAAGVDPALPLRRAESVHVDRTGVRPVPPGLSAGVAYPDGPPDAPLPLTLADELLVLPPDPAHREATRHFERGEAARRDGQFQVAQTEYKAALALVPAEPDTLHQLGLVEAYDKAYAPGLEHLAAAQKLAPLDSDITLDRARVLSWSGDQPAAVALVDTVLNAEPENAEALDLRARLALYQAHPVEAEALARRALAHEPDNGDFKLTLAQTLSAQQQYPQAAALAREVASARPGDSEAALLLQAIPPDPATVPVLPWRLDMSISHSSFQRIAESAWEGLSLQLSNQLSPANTVYGRIDQAHRFGQNNYALTAGIAHVFSPDLAGYAEVSGTPNASFFPGWRLGGGAEWRVRPDSDALGATFLTVDASVAHYLTGDNYGLSPGVVQYLLQGRLWLSGRFINSIDTQSHYLNGYSLRADGLPTLAGDWGVYAGYAHAPESDSGVISMVRSLLLGTSWQLRPDLGLHLDYLHEDRSNSYIRQELLLGAWLRF